MTSNKTIKFQGFASYYLGSSKRYCLLLEKYLMSFLFHLILSKSKIARFINDSPFLSGFLEVPTCPIWFQTNSSGLNRKHIHQLQHAGVMRQCCWIKIIGSFDKIDKGKKQIDMAKNYHGRGYTINFFVNDYCTHTANRIVKVMELIRIKRKT